jgi:soluble lytic murein transglycosylase
VKLQIKSRKELGKVSAHKKTSAAKKFFIFLLISGGIIILIFLRLDYIKQTYFYPKKYTDIVTKYAESYGLDEDIIYAIINTESSFDPNAESSVGARGLMQIMEDAFLWTKSRMPDSENDDNAVYDDMYDPELNIKYGAYLFYLLYDEYGDYETALAAYHTGRGNVNKWLEQSENSTNGRTLNIKIPSEATAHYVDKAMNSYKNYQALYD